MPCLYINDVCNDFQFVSNEVTAHNVDSDSIKTFTVKITIIEIGSLSREEKNIEEKRGDERVRVEERRKG